MGRPKKGAPGDAEATAKMKRTMIEKYGVEGYHKKMQEIGRKGGKFCGKKGFALNPELAKKAGTKGGSVSRRGQSEMSRKMNDEKEKIVQMLKDGYSKKEVAAWLDVGYLTFLRWAKKNLTLEVLYYYDKNA